MTKENAFDNLMEMIENNDSIEIDYTNCIKFMLVCIPLVEAYSPKVALDAFSVAKKYWLEKTASLQDLENSRVECWTYLDSNSATISLQEKRFCAVRAVICVLYPEPPGESIIDLISWFIEILYEVGEYTTKITEAFQLHCPQITSPNPPL